MLNVICCITCPLHSHVHKNVICLQSLSVFIMFNAIDINNITSKWYWLKSIPDSQSFFHLPYDFPRHCKHPVNLTPHGAHIMSNSDYISINLVQLLMRKFKKSAETLENNNILKLYILL